MTADPDRSSGGAAGSLTEPLLDRITRQSLDADYEAADRGADRQPGRWPTLRPGTTAAVVVFGLLLGTAAVQTSRNAPDAASSHEALVAQIERRRDQVDGLQSRAQDLREQTTALALALERTGQEERSTLGSVERLRATTGFGPVTGPGVRAVVDDAPDGGDAGRVRDEDLAKLVDGLWNAGADAVAVNGQRLTALSPIRTSGLAIHVHNTPLSPPYVVTAVGTSVGDAGGLQARFAETTHGLDWLSLVATFGFRFEMTNEDELTLPAQRLPALRQVRAARRSEPGGDGLRGSSS